jgi:lanosterol synthase
MFGVRGLLAAGAPPTDTAIRRACRWLLAHQRPDGAWGEAHETALMDRYAPHRDGQVVQTAWALTALLEAREPNWAAIDGAARFLAAAQGEDGAWPTQDRTGVFFRTALLDYTLYPRIFPVWALALYERRRRARLPFISERAAREQAEQA